MNIYLCGILPIIGFAAGSFFAAYTGAEYKRLLALKRALESLELNICTYSKGLTDAISGTNIMQKCELFDDIKAALSLGSVSGAIRRSPYPDEVKEALVLLFDTVTNADGDKIRQSFTATLVIVQNALHKAKLDQDKNAPLYRKIGALAGLAVGILCL